MRPVNTEAGFENKSASTPDADRISPGNTSASQATPPGKSPISAHAGFFQRATAWHLIGLQWLACLVMVFLMLGLPVRSGRTGMMNLTESYGALDRVAMWQHHLSWIPGVAVDGGAYRLPVDASTWLFRAALLTMFVLWAWAFWWAWSGKSTRFGIWLLGPIGAQAIMLLFIPSNADIFFYEMSGDLANNGFNPYTHYLYEFSHNPLLPYNHWVDMTTVYGPTWTGINRFFMDITGPDPYVATLVYKAFFGVLAIALASVCYWFVKSLTGSVKLATAAGVFVAWQPNMITENAGQAHNDIVVILLSTLGIVLVVTGGISALRGGLILVMLSATVKYVTLPLAGILGLLRLFDHRRAHGLRRITTAWILDGLAILAVIIATFLPYWDGIDTYKEMLFEPGRLFAHPIWLMPYFLLTAIAPGSVVDFYVSTMRTTLQLATFALLGYSAWRFVSSLWHNAPGEPDVVEASPPGTAPYAWWTRHLLAAWAAIMAIMALVPANSHAWYWTWSVTPIAVLVCFDRSRCEHPDTDLTLPRWFWWYVGLMCVMTMIYHTRVVHH